ncbi:hypothetical protein [Marinivivus vitaminiproducens]|uniref:hypothetical protein n=1 Tax=Marinivivus vitaminiproducens TaxID=3035935 RepID=UPI0027A964C4|nr:hypothetical protein P4R82_18395 [Geminicoccaceae bacterium SCSIO 64248]
MNRAIVVALAALVSIGLTEPAFAYIGPGAGLSLLGAVWGLFVALLAAVGFLLLWPLRRMMRRSKAGTNAATETTAEPARREPQGASAPRSV